MDPLLARITFDAKKNFGRPGIRGMRVRVEDVLNMLAAGDTAEDILDGFPYLEPDDIRACLAYGAAMASWTRLETR